MVPSFGRGVEEGETACVSPSALLLLGIGGCPGHGTKPCHEGLTVLKEEQRGEAEVSSLQGCDRTHGHQCLSLLLLFSRLIAIWVLIVVESKP